MEAEVRTGILEVRAVERVTPRMVRITLGGDCLKGLPDVSGATVALYWPAAGTDEIVLPTDVLDTGPPEQHRRGYTIRSCDLEAETVDIDFVVHGDHGRASLWADNVVPGAKIGFSGPAPSYESPSSDWTLLAADETGLPAIVSGSPMGTLVASTNSTGP